MSRNNKYNPHKKDDDRDEESGGIVKHMKDENKDKVSILANQVKAIRNIAKG
jgi:hypothetical protein